MVVIISDHSRYCALISCKITAWKALPKKDYFGLSGQPRQYREKPVPELASSEQ